MSAPDDEPAPPATPDDDSVGPAEAADAGQAPPLRASRVEDGRLVLTFPDPEHALAGVRLWAHLSTPLEREYASVPGGWQLAQPVPDLDRLEYLVEIREAGHAGGEADAAAEAGPAHLGLDPTNPLRVGGAFGDHSWLPMPGYAPPAWTATPPAEHHVETWTLEHGAGAHDGELVVRVVSPRDTGPADALPMVMAHDGPEMDALGGLVHCLDALAAAGRAPRVRVALLSPGPDRDARYSARPEYARTLTTATAVLTSRWPTPGAPVLLGASLGALAALHAEWTQPGTFAGLFLASGSYFTPALDPGESSFPHWDAITSFTAEVAAADRPPAAPPVALVCGTAEENLGNNEAMAAHLRRLGLDVDTATVRDGHCYTAWRDLLDPALPDLLRRAWGGPGAAEATGTPDTHGTPDSTGSPEEP